MLSPVFPDDAMLEAALAHYRAFGYARLGAVFGEADLEMLRERAEDLMLGRVRYDGMFFQHDSETNRYEDLSYRQGFVGPSLSYRKLEKLEKDDRFRALIENALFARIARRLIGPELVIYRATLFNKAATGSSPIPWHQDGGSYWGLDRDPELQIWTALDDVPESAGCVEVLSESHAAGLATPLGGVIPDDVLARRLPMSEPLRLPARAGEVLLIHNYLWHRSGPNASGHARRAVTVCYMDAATRCLRKKRAPRTFEPVFREVEGG
jgi:phytanoyl-CoA hydroxylase